MQNAVRFLNAYNKIDETIRSLYNFKANMTFTDIIRRTVPLNYVVRMYEDDLVAYARLRNAIVHRSVDGMVIAEPHDDVTEHMEKIAKLVATPPTVETFTSGHKVKVLRGDRKLKSAIEEISRTNYSNMPVYRENTMIGIINNKIIVEALGGCIAAGGDIEKFISQTDVSKIAENVYMEKYYTILPRGASLEKVLNVFMENRKLLAVIITEDGTRLSEAIGIITTGDVIEITNILDNY